MELLEELDELLEEELELELLLDELLLEEELLDELDVVPLELLPPQAASDTLHKRSVNRSKDLLIIVISPSAGIDFYAASYRMQESLPQCAVKQPRIIAPPGEAVQTRTADL